MYLSSKNVARPVVIIADGHISRFDTKVLKFLKDSNMRLHITPPDTTGVTQLLDQLNQSLHSEYRNTKNNLFSPECTINREGFMQILAGIWESWTDSDSIVNAGKRVGVSKKGVGVHWMQQDKFAQAVSVIKVDEPGPSTSTANSSLVASPQGVKRYTKTWYKSKLDGLELLVTNLEKSAKSVPIKEIPGLLSEKGETQRVNQKCEADPGPWLHAGKGYIDSG